MLFVVIVSLAVTLELLLQKMEIDRCGGTGACVDRFRSWGDIAKNGIGAAVLSSFLLLGHNRAITWLEHAVTGGVPQPTGRVARPRRLISGIAVASVIGVCFGFAVWVAAEGAPSPWRGIVAIELSTCSAALLASLAILVRWNRRSRRGDGERRDG